MESTDLRKEAGSKPPSPTFDVFLSYSRKDRDFAVKLENALESYRYPQSLKRDKRNLNVFRDEADIEAAEDYYRTIEGHLKGSAKLVVLCSPDARHSKFVEDELRRFIESHSEQDVIPVLVRGKANNETTDESEKAFPEVLCGNRIPLAANFLGHDVHKGRLDKGPFRSSFFSILSAIYGIDRRRLEQIDERQRARRRAIALGTAAAIILILSVALVFALISRHQAVVARNEAFARELAANAMAQLPVNPELSLLLAVEGARTAQTVETENALRQALVKSPLLVIHAGTRERISATFSPDAKRILTTSGTKAQVWDMQSGRSILELPHEDEVTSRKYSPDGKLIATAAKDVTHIWDAANGSSIAKWKSSEGEEPGEITFSPDSRSLLVEEISEQSRLRVREARSGRILARLEGQRPSFSHDGRLLLTKGADPESVLYIYDAKSWKLSAQIKSAPMGREGLAAGALSPNGRYVVASSDNDHLRYYALKGQRLLYEDTEEAASVPVAFSPDGKLIAGVGGNVLQVLNTAARRGQDTPSWVKGEFKEAPILLGDISFSPDSRFVLTDSDIARLYDVKSEDMRLVAELTGARGVSVLNAEFSPDGKYLMTAHDDGTVFVWDLNVWRSPVEMIVKPDDPAFTGTVLNAAAFSPDGKLVATAEEYLLDEARLSENQPENRPSSLARVLEISSGRTIRLLQPQSTLQSVVAFNPDGKLILINSDDHTMRVRELSSGRSLLELKHQDEAVLSAAFSPDGKLIATGSSSAARLWDAKSGQLLKEWKVGDEVTSVTFSPDGKLFLMAAKGRAQMWDIGNQRIVFEMSEAAGITNASFSPDGKLILTWAYISGLTNATTSVQVRDARNGRVVGDLRGHIDSVYNASFSPNSRYVVTTTQYLLTGNAGVFIANDANEVRVWDVSSGSTIYEFKGHNSPLVSGMFGPDGKSVLAGAKDGTIMVYACEVCASQDELLKLAEKRNLRPLTPDERARYLHEAER
jgi:WD40 repeat protein